jgi:hypothetical protein
MITAIENTFAPLRSLIPNRLFELRHLNPAKVLEGKWKIKFFQCAPGFDASAVIGQVLDFRESGMICTKNGKQFYYGNWQFSECGGYLDISLRGNWQTFIVSNKWTVHSIRAKSIKLYAHHGNHYHELHLTAN